MADIDEAVPVDPPDPPEEDEGEEFLLLEEAADIRGECEAREHDRRLLDTIGAMLASRSQDPDPSPRVQYAYDMLHIAACDRGIRILNADLPPVEDF
jgi:hypothetical protein